MFALAVTPFYELERGFYKSTAGILLTLALLGLWGRFNLYRRTVPFAPELSETLGILFFSLFIIFLAFYFFSLWGEWVQLRARLFSSALFAGLAGLSLTAFSFHNAPFWSIETFFYPISLVLSALLLGSVTVSMLIGHWYLIDTGQSLEPIYRTFKIFVVLLITQTSFLVVLPVVFYLLGNHETVTGLTHLWKNHLMLVSGRFLLSQIGPLVLSYMIWQTLKIPNTMAATGLFYI
ncbi:MAG: hypothetical protein QGG48_13395, partial [Desulfatiglandales bacterium]|nr:hypothetical protein [Desulfatiglandales bacterium]